MLRKWLAEQRRKREFLRRTVDQEGQELSQRPYECFRSWWDTAKNELETA